VKLMFLFPTGSVVEFMLSRLWLWRLYVMFATFVSFALILR